MSSEVGTWSWAPRKRGVNTEKSVGNQTKRFMEGLTVSLNGIVGDPTQHGEFGGPIQPKPLAHPGEEMRQTEVATSHALGDTGTPTGEGQGSYAVWAKHNVRVGSTKVHVRFEDILSHGITASRNFSVWEDFHCGDFNVNLQLCR